MTKYRCLICNNLFDEDYGDPISGIEPGTIMYELPEEWDCPICGSGKENYARVETEDPAELIKRFFALQGH